MTLQVQYAKKNGEWENLGKPQSMSTFVEWWNANLKSNMYLVDKYGIKMLRAVDESGNIVHGIGSKDYKEFVEIKELERQEMGRWYDRNRRVC